MLVDKPQIQKAQKMPRKINFQKKNNNNQKTPHEPSHIIFKLQWSKSKKKMLEKQEKGKAITLTTEEQQPK